MDLLDPGDVRVFKVPLSRNRTFQVNMNNADVQCLASTANEDESWLWHSRLGHLNFKGLNQLQSQKLVDRLPRIRIPHRICERCLTSKQLRNSFKSESPTRVIEVLGVVYSDVCGPLEVCSMGGNKYFVTFIDEFNRMMCLYQIKAKSEVLSIFKEFKVLSEKTKWKGNQGY